MITIYKLCTFRVVSNNVEYYFFTFSWNSLKLVFIYFRNQVQKVWAKARLEGLDAKAIFANFDNLDATGKDSVKSLLEKGLINSWGRPELTALLRQKLGVKSKRFSIGGYLYYYLIPNLIALGQTLLAPFAGIFYVAHRTFLPINQHKHSYYSLWLAKGKEFWVSFWHYIHAFDIKILCKICSWII